MKYSKRILSLLGLAVIAGTLTSCDVNRNTKTPTGNLNLEAKYAQLSSNNNISVLVNDMYNQFRSNGYSTVLTKIKEKLFETEISKITYESKKDEIDEYLLNQIYSVSTVEDYNDLDDEEIDICIQKFIDNQLSTYGVDLSGIDKSIFKPEYNKEEDSLKYNWGKYEDIYSSYKYTLAIIDYAKDYLASIREYKTLYDVDGEEVENDYYLPKTYDAEDEDAEEQRENIYNKIKDLTATKDLLSGRNPYENEEGYETKNQAIVIKFASKKEAEKYIQKTAYKLRYDLSKTGISVKEVKNFYVTLFDLYYKTKNIGSSENILTSEYSSFISDYDNNEMTDELGTAAVEFMTENLVDESDYDPDHGDSFYLSEPFNISGDNNYYMCCRISIYEGAEWDELSLDDKKTLCANYIDDLIVENWATESYANGLVEDLLQGTIYTTTKDASRGKFDLEIYDPIYENQYYNSYEDYYDFSSKKNFNNNYVFTLSYAPCEGDVKAKADAKYTVDDSYDDLNKIYGADKASSLLTSKYLANTFLIDKIDEDTVEGYEDGLKSVIKSFKKNNTSYSKKMGITNYLVLQYGFDNQNDILYYNLMASDLISAYSSYYGKFWNDGVYIDSKNSDGSYINSDMTDELVHSAYYQVGENLLALDESNNLLNIFYEYAKKKYDSYYSLDISHMLISVDYDHDGNNDDPEEFYNSLSAVNKNLFREAVLTLADAIVKEAAIIKTTTKVEALQFIASTFNNPGYGYVLKCEDYKGRTWTSFTDKYEFSLRAEDLSTIDYSNGSNYVEEFTDEVIALYDKLSSDDYEEVAENISDYGYWNYEPYKYKVDEEDNEYQTLFENNCIDINASNLEQLTETVYGWHMLYVYDMTSQTSCQFTRSNDSSSSSSVKNDDGQIMYYKKDEDGNYVIYTETEAKGDADSIDSSFTKLSSIKTWEYQDIIVYENDDDTTDDDIKLYVSGYSSEDYASIAQIFIYFMETVNLGSVSSLRSTTSTAVGNVVSDVISRFTNSSFQSWRLYKQIGNIEFLEGSESNTLTTGDLSKRYGLIITKLQNTIDSYETLEEDDIFFGWFDDKNDWTIDLTVDYSDYSKLND